MGLQSAGGVLYCKIHFFWIVEIIPWQGSWAGFLFVSCLAWASQDHRRVDQDIVWSKPIPSRQSRLFWTVSWWVWNISRDGNPTACPRVQPPSRCLPVECPGIQLFWQNWYRFLKALKLINCCTKEKSNLSLSLTRLNHILLCCAPSLLWKELWLHLQTTREVKKKISHCRAGNEGRSEGKWRRGGGQDLT